jgi:hypothetical protein
MVAVFRQFLTIERYGPVAVVILALGSAGSAAAQSYDAMSCDELWYARNAIYAAKGYCFKTSRAQQVFGQRCFPPFGALTLAEKEQVNQIQQVEAARGCSGEAGPPVTPPRDYAQMSCNQLWHARNAIYAAKGYCFKTARAKREFGPGCFPPYGSLSADERQRVSTIQQLERNKGCQEAG